MDGNIMQGETPAAAATTLSELEGAILSELYHRGAQSAFKVRRSFAISPSLEWRGSAGAVYAAIGRLEKSALIAAEIQADRRGTRLLRITETGVARMLSWACDPVRAISVGMDPFRLRSGIWRGLPAGDQARVFDRLVTALQADIDNLIPYAVHKDLIETTSIELAIRLQESRLAWLRAQIDKNRG